MKTSKDGLVTFDEEKHIYQHVNGKYLQGITSLISRYKNKFDSEAKALEMSRGNKEVANELLGQWKEKSDSAINCGKAVHKIFEDFSLTGVVDAPGLYEKETGAIKFIEDIFYTGRLKPIEVECIIHNDIVASQIDMIVENYKGEYYILDWKTNDEIKTNGYGKKMLTPFNLLPDASYFHYSLQVSFYENLCKDYDINGSFIVQINKDGYNIMKPENITIHDDFFLTI